MWPTLLLMYVLNGKPSRLYRTKASRLQLPAAAEETGPSDLVIWPLRLIGVMHTPPLSLPTGIKQGNRYAWNACLLKNEELYWPEEAFEVEKGEPVDRFATVKKLAKNKKLVGFFVRLYVRYHSGGKHGHG